MTTRSNTHPTVETLLHGYSPRATLYISKGNSPFRYVGGLLLSRSVIFGPLFAFPLYGLYVLFFLGTSERPDQRFWSHWLGALIVSIGLILTHLLWSMFHRSSVAKRLDCTYIEADYFLTNEGLNKRLLKQPWFSSIGRTYIRCAWGIDQDARTLRDLEQVLKRCQDERHAQNRVQLEDVIGRIRQSHPSLHESA